MADRAIRILLVEDNPGDARLLQMVLAQVDSLRFELTHVTRLAEALRWLAAGCTDVVLLDLSLPDAQGFQTFARAHTAAPQVPIILLTGLDDGAFAARAVREGAQDYLVKGQVDGNLLVRAVRYAIERKRVEQTLRRYSGRIELLHNIDRAILGALSPGAIAEAALSRLAPLVSASYAAVVTFDHQARQAGTLAVHTSEQAAAHAEMRFSLESFQHLNEFQQGQVQVVDDISVLPSPTPLECSLDSLGVRSYGCIPLQTQGIVTGTLLLGAQQRGHWKSDHIKVASEVAHSLALAIQQAKLRQNLESQTVRLQTSLREKELLLQEIHHRVKNNLQITSSLLRVQAAQVKDQNIREALRDSQNRIKSMSLIHEKLYQSKDLSRIDFGVYVDDLARYLFGAYRGLGGHITLSLDVCDCTLEIDTAIPCGLIINELVSNALKHAFPDGRKGEIRISLQTVDGHYVLTVHDDGIGLPADLDLSGTNSLGMVLINTLVEQIDGTLEWSRNGGTAATITLSLPQ
jgi:two-component sensor histidine kinase/CheY-like chemotaxis protein